MLKRYVEFGVGGVHQDVGAGLNLGDARHAAGDIEGAGATGRNDLAGQAGATDRLDAGSQTLHRVVSHRCPLITLRNADGVTLVAHYPAQPDATRVGDSPG